MEETEQSEFDAWLKTRPESVQKLARTYPPGWYRIKGGAPYGISTPGTIVRLYSYSEDGEIGVVVHARHKRPDALQHERMLAAKHGRGPFHGKDVVVSIDPAWMEPCAPGEAQELH